MNHILNHTLIPTLTIQQIATLPMNTTPRTEVDDAMPSDARQLSTIFANDVSNTPVLYPTQMQVSKRLCVTKFKFLYTKPATLLFVQPTGGGKSLVRVVLSVLRQGVLLTSVPILLLVADQHK